MSRLYDAVAAFVSARAAYTAAEDRYAREGQGARRALLAAKRQYDSCASEFSDALTAMAHGIAYERLGVEEVHEVSSETFVRYLSAKGPTDPRPEAQVVWLRTVATNLANGLAGAPVCEPIDPAKVETPEGHGVGTGDPEVKFHLRQEVPGRNSSDPLCRARERVAADVRHAFEALRGGDSLAFLDAFAADPERLVQLDDPWLARAAERQCHVRLVRAIARDEALKEFALDQGLVTKKALAEASLREARRRALAAGRATVMAAQRESRRPSLGRTAKQLELKAVDGHESFEVLALEPPDSDLGWRWRQARGQVEEQELVRNTLDRRLSRYRPRLQEVIESVAEDLRPALAEVAFAGDGLEGSDS